VTQSRVQTNFGLLYSTNSLYLGLSGINILPSNRSSASYTLNSSRLLTLTAGYNYKLNDNWDVRPSVFAKLGGQESKYLAIDIAIIGFLKQKYISGIGYRVGDAISLCLGYSISPNLKFIYSYGYSVNRLSSVNNGTHEILFGYDWPLNISRFNNNIIKSPRFL
jgi:type IX secretion system PorP/SprF family membrane protein